ncbi:DUF427 domain-containing protein [Pseudarthrobacter cellobiosi]|uniref:DUF427 domain-containing protein n=1 Tax=Pseudarthrobacter cellobiosi TaxID=2953654 RepID=UPI00208FBB9F|nr:MULTISPECIES: DUF427 domain-containing protein [unclassified Pseudarthrobacter]MCO4255425.1 DUF427 domain-containing protein [Pseudarthrobacter sp. HLT1-5]MCO4276838.1 DUF427 domain-containing protein [Pseudarthrobacter sp. HLT3-5]
MITAAFHGQVIARSEQTVYLEGNHYFPRESLVPDALEDSWVRTLCFWKGVAFYHHVRAGGHRSPNAAWSYPRPTPLARMIKGHVAFAPGGGVIVSDDHP